jgi:hypothetical protein
MLDLSYFVEFVPLTNVLSEPVPVDAQQLHSFGSVNLLDLQVEYCLQELDCLSGFTGHWQ